MPKAKENALIRARIRFELGQSVARILCAVFALLGALPLGGEMLARTERVERWAEMETARTLERLLGIEASYRVEMHVWPLQVVLHDVRVNSSDGGSPALITDRLAVTPRLFSLLAGQLDVGDIEIDEPRGRLVFESGALTNLDYKLPESDPNSGKLTRSPFASISVTDGSFDVSIHGLRVKSGTLDLDVFADAGPSYEVALRLGASEITGTRPGTPEETEEATNGTSDDDAPSALTGISGNDDSAPAEEGTPAEPVNSKSAPTPSARLPLVDEDIVCQLDLRVRAEPGSILVRRLSLIGYADLSGDPGSRPACTPASLATQAVETATPESADTSTTLSWDDGPDRPNRVSLQLSQLRVVLGEAGPTLIDGHITAELPSELSSRFRGPEFTGWVALSGALRHDFRRKLPNFRGTVRTGRLKLGTQQLANGAHIELRLDNDKISATKIVARYANGEAVITGISLDPFARGIPISVKHADLVGLTFPGLLRAIDVPPDTVVRWDLDHVVLKRFHGTISPLQIAGDLSADTSDFEIFDRAFYSPARQHMFGIAPDVSLVGRFKVTGDSVQFLNMTARFGKSTVKTSVSIGFDNQLWVKVEEGTQIHLAETSPLVTIPVSGVLEIQSSLAGLASNPLMTGNLRIKNLVFGGFPVGDIGKAKLKFEPLKVNLTELVGKAGNSQYSIARARFDFDTAAAIKLDAVVRSESMDIRDFFGMLNFESDPRWNSVTGRSDLSAKIQYVLGGPDDPCKTGNLTVDGEFDFAPLNMFGEHYDTAALPFHLAWRDIDAGNRGFDLDVPSLTLTKGSGTMLGSARVRSGGKLQAHVIATGIPVSHIQALGTMAQGVDGYVNVVAEAAGTLNSPSVSATGSITELRVGRKTLPPSSFSGSLRPIAVAAASAKKTACGQPIAPPFDRADYDADESQGTFHMNAKLYGGQIQFHDLRVSYQRRKRLWGTIDFAAADLGAALELTPQAALVDRATSGALSGQLEIESLPLDRMALAKGRANISEMWLDSAGTRIELLAATQVEQAQGTIEFQKLLLGVTRAGHQAKLNVNGSLLKLHQKPAANLDFALHGINLASLTALIPGAERSAGVLSGHLHVEGPLTSLSQSGEFRLKKGEIAMRGFPAALRDLNIVLLMQKGELKITEGSALVGGGTLTLSGRAPIRNSKLGAARGKLVARNVSLPLGSGLQMNTHADLDLSWHPQAEGNLGRGPLPRVSGVVTLQSFEYSRPVTMAADISSLAGRGKRTSFEAYDPANDHVAFHLNIRAAKTLRLNNNLIEAELKLAEPGLLLTGTDQRFGMRGRMAIVQGGRIRLRRNEFEIQQGHIRFDDPTRIAPQVDVTAVTEYRRYNTAASTTGSTDGTASSGSATSGLWRITLRAHGDADKLKIDLSSEPNLSQDDIFLLLTLGLTRTELEQAQSASVGSSMALEALGSITGADQAVTSAIPVIDEFSVGSRYSSKSGRTEPTVTIGKRLTERIRALVTSSVSDSREVRSNLEWRLKPGLSVESSYDNVNDISSSALGNLGADIRWRLEFE